MEAHRESAAARALAYAEDEREALRDELDDVLRRHRPRAPHLEEEDRRARSLELLNQERTFDRYLRAAARTARHEDERFVKAVEDAEASVAARAANISSLEASLADVASAKGLEIR